MKSALKTILLILISSFAKAQIESNDSLKNYTFEEVVISVNKETTEIIITNYVEQN